MPVYRLIVWTLVLLASVPGRLVELRGDEHVEPLVIADNRPPVQMLVPGFSVSKLPVELTNINNLRYRSDGKLYALAYSGDVWVLSDSNGDGLEDTASRFFDSQGRLRGPIGMAVIPDGHALLEEAPPALRAQARGVVVASKGKVSALLDLDGDDRAEQERIIATGWTEIPQNVDAVGVAIHPDDGAIYFGLGCAAYNNAYLLDESGRSQFELSSERGTIQRIAPDLSQRTTVCTGVRFTIGMAFDGQGELLVTDQEGATWLPNGNPFDELLHIRPGRHYGFPPRHPRHLPHVFDEPSVYDYGPQHQSTCGMMFNLPLVPGGPTFGPAGWRGDAFVCGESRGKLYRTRLQRDAHGAYIAENHLIGCLELLTVDCCLTPQGDLLVCCHSGGPDWGTGPTGPGTIFRIRYDAPQLPQPVAVWSAGRQEVRVTFDRPLDPQDLTQLAPRCHLTYGEYVAAGDRFESIRPGYAVTQMQQTVPRYRLPVYTAGVTPDRRTLILSTAPHQSAVAYALTLPGMGRTSAVSTEDMLPQHPAIDLAYGLRGVWGTWEPREKGVEGWSGWLPHLDLTLAATFAADDAGFRRLRSVLEQPGTLTLTTQFDPRGLFRPVVQPGSKLDYDPVDDDWVRRSSLQFEGAAPFTVAAAGQQHPERSVETDGVHRLTVDVPQHDSPLLPLTVRLETGSRPASLAVFWSATLGDASVRTGPIALERMILPWGERGPRSESVPTLDNVRKLAGASPVRGRQVFFSEDAACFKCHRTHGEGGEIGPDLSNLPQRDYESVLRDISRPGFAIHPDYITYVAALHDGRVLTGAVRSDGDHLLIGDRNGQVVQVARADIASLQPSELSIMPEGVEERLGAERLADLLAFLLTTPPAAPAPASSEAAGSPAGGDTASRQAPPPVPPQPSGGIRTP
jgi:putative heme-binding domain-containing protein